MWNACAGVCCGLAQKLPADGRPPRLQVDQESIFQEEFGCLSPVVMTRFHKAPDEHCCWSHRSLCRTAQPLLQPARTAYAALPVFRHALSAFLRRFINMVAVFASFGSKSSSAAQRLFTLACPDAKTYPLSLETPASLQQPLQISRSGGSMVRTTSA